MNSQYDKPVPAQNPTAVAPAQGQVSGMYNPNPTMAYHQQQVGNTSGWPQHMLASNPNQETMSSIQDLSQQALNQQVAQTPGQVLSQQPGFGLTNKQLERQQPQQVYAQQPEQVQQVPQLPQLVKPLQHQEREQVLSTRLDINYSQAYICHASQRNSSLQTPYGIINLDSEGVSIVSLNVAQKLHEQWPNEFSYRAGNQRIDLFERGEAPPGADTSTVVDPRTGETLAVARSKKVQQQETSGQAQQAQQQEMSLQEQVVFLQQQVESLANDNLLLKQDNEVSFEDRFQNPTLREFILSLEKSNPEVVALIKAVFDSVKNERPDLAVGLIWTAFDSFLGKLPVKIAKVLGQANVQFSEAEEEETQEVKVVSKVDKSKKKKKKSPKKAKKAKSNSKKFDKTDEVSV